MQRMLWLTVLSLFLGFGCAHHGNHGDKAAKKKDCGCHNKAQSWGDLEYREYHKLHFTAQPDEAAMKAAAQDGVKVLINLRTPSEMKSLNFDEKATAEKLGMTYYNIPVDGKNPLSADDMAKIEKTVMKHHKGSDAKIWLHCSTGNRAAAWFAAHLVHHHSDSPEKAIEQAKKMGLTDEASLKKVQAYLGTENKTKK